MNNKELEQLFKLLSDTDIHTFKLEKTNFKLKIKRGHVTEAIAPVIQSTQVTHTVQEDSDVNAAAPEKEQKGNIKYIVSPMVGTFYRSPSPDSQPFIEKGDRVSKDDVMCIIEAMKLFNEIESDLGGIVVDILVENGQPVEYGEKLFAIDIS
ncbi:acetyl-CoA carboxylase biotin carboxyl carrier protein [Thermodesulfobacteriota bacterium]